MNPLTKALKIKTGAEKKLQSIGRAIAARENTPAFKEKVRALNTGWRP